jgi:hypothetical protein
MDLTFRHPIQNFIILPARAVILPFPPSLKAQVEG